MILSLCGKLGIRWAGKKVRPQELNLELGGEVV